MLSLSDLTLISRISLSLSLSDLSVYASLWYLSLCVCLCLSVCLSVCLLVTALLSLWMSPRINFFMSSHIAIPLHLTLRLLSASFARYCKDCWFESSWFFSPLSEMSRLEMFGISAMQPSRIWDPPDRSYDARGGENMLDTLKKYAWNTKDQGEHSMKYLELMRLLEQRWCQPKMAVSAIATMLGMVSEALMKRLVAAVAHPCSRACILMSNWADEEMAQ